MLLPPAGGSVCYHHQQDLSGLLWQASYLTLRSSASGPTFLPSPLLPPSSSQINCLSLITSPCIGPGFATAIPSCGISEAIPWALTASHSVSGSLAPHDPPWLSCQVVYLLQSLRHSCSTSALIPAQADQALAGPYLAVYILQSSSRGTYLSPSASAAGTSALWGCVLQQGLLLTSHPRVCLTPLRTFRPRWVLVNSVPSGWKPPQL